jgi:hypothetical protein
MDMTESKLRLLRRPDPLDPARREAEALPTAQELCERAAQIKQTLDAERWLSSLLGQMWSARDALIACHDPHDDPDWAFQIGGPLARELAAVGGPEALAVLHGLWVFAPERLARLAGDLLDTLPRTRPLEWSLDVGRALPREVVCSTGSGRTSGHAYVVTRRLDSEEPNHLVALKRGTFTGPVTHLSLHMSFAEAEALALELAPQKRKRPKLDTGYLEQAAEAIRLGIRCADGHPDNERNPEFAELRALTLQMLSPWTRDARFERHRRPWEPAAEEYDGFW